MIYDTLRVSRLLRERLSPARLHHSLCVRKRAARLAAIHGADWYKASLAGLLHDIWRRGTPMEQLQYLEAHGILLDDFWQEHPSIWHALCGYLYVREELGVRDPEVLNAIRYHTTGRAEMSALEKVVFLADTTSEDRDFPGVEQLRQTADRSLDEGMAISLRRTALKMVEQGLPLVRDAWEAYNCYCVAPPEPAGKE